MSVHKTHSPTHPQVSDFTHQESAKNCVTEGNVLRTPEARAQTR
jgi:hypothetical protein